MLILSDVNVQEVSWVAFPKFPRISWGGLRSQPTIRQSVVLLYKNTKFEEAAFINLGML